jgi:phage-related protein
LFATGGALGPYGLVAVGVAAVALLIYQNWDKIKEFLLNTWEGIKSAAEAVWGGIKGFFTRLWDGLIEYHRTTMEAWHSLFSTAWERIRGVAETVWGNIKGFFLKIWDGLEAYHQASMEQTHSILSSIWEKTKGVAETIWGGIKSFFLRVWEGVNAYHEASMEQTNAILTTSWELIKRGAETVWGGIRSFFVGFWDNIKSKWETAWSGIQGFLESTWESISEKATKAWDTIKKGAKSLWERLVGHSIIPDMVTAINEEFNRIDSSIAVKRMKTLEQKFSEISGASVVSAKQMVQELNGVFGSLNIAPAASEIEGFGMSFEASTDKVLRGALQMEEAFGRVINWNTQLKASFDSLEMSVERTTKSIDALMDKVLGVVSQIGNIVINMSFGERPTAGQVGGLLSSILNFFVGIPKWISTVLQTIFGWIDNYRKKLEELIKSVLGQMTGALKEFFEAPSLQQAINTFGERLKNIVYQMLVDAVVKAIVASEAVRRAAEALGKAINEAIKKATVGGVFNPQTFMSIAGPAINAFAQFWQNTMLPVLEQTFQALQPYNPRAGEPQYVTVSGTFTKSLDLGWVANTKKTTTVASIGDINININVAEGNPELIASQIWDELSFEARRRGVEWWP